MRACEGGKSLHACERVRRVKEEYYHGWLFFRTWEGPHPCPIQPTDHISNVPCQQQTQLFFFLGFKYAVNTEQDYFNYDEF